MFSLELTLPGKTSFSSGLFRIQPFLCCMMHWNMVVPWLLIVQEWLIIKNNGGSHFTLHTCDAGDYWTTVCWLLAGVANSIPLSPSPPSPIIVVISLARASTMNSRLTSVTFASNPPLSITPGCLAGSSCWDAVLVPTSHSNWCNHSNNELPCKLISSLSIRLLKVLIRRDP